MSSYSKALGAIGVLFGLAGMGLSLSVGAYGVGALFSLGIGALLYAWAMTPPGNQERCSAT